MHARVIALAVPLALGAACSHGGRTGAVSQPAGPARQAAAGGTSADPLSQDPIMRPGPSIKGHAEDLIVSGRVADASESQLIVETPLGDRRALQIVPETTVELDGMEASSSDLTEGQPVRASYAEVEGQEIAVHVRAGDRAAGVGDPGMPGMSGTGSAGSGSEPGVSGTGSSGSSGPRSREPGTGPSSDPATPAPAPDRETAPDAGWGAPPGADAPPSGQR